MKRDLMDDAKNVAAGLLCFVPFALFMAWARLHQSSFVAVFTWVAIAGGCALVLWFAWHLGVVARLILGAALSGADETKPAQTGEGEG